MRDSSSHYSFNALDIWRILVGSASNEGITLSSAHFFSIYILRILLILSISSLLIFERESSSPLLSSTHPLLFSACSSSLLKPFFFKKLTHQ